MPTESTTAQHAYIVADNGRELQLHRGGCSDIKRRGLRVIGWGDTHQDAANEAAYDFLNEGSMTEADALAECHILPCAHTA
jgi:hypothetical protein